MTISEASQLVIQSGAMAKGGDVYVLDMGRPVKILDLAHRMIELSGLTAKNDLAPNGDIMIEVIGLRPGEKLYEELLNDGENTGNTYHDKIMIAKVREVEFIEVSKHFSELFTIVSSNESDMYLVAKMKEIGAVIGGEGNGGIIYPESHYGRDALVGIALFLSHLAEKKCKVSELRDHYPAYTISKNKIELTPNVNVDDILNKMAQAYAHEEVDTTDGVKIYIGKEWVHLRKSNTEPIIRIYSESKNANAADALAKRIITEIQAIIK